MHYTGVRDGKKGKKLNEISALCFFHTRYFNIQNLKTLALSEAEKSVTKHFIGEKEKHDK